jgi:hypothetical protein
MEQGISDDEGMSFYHLYKMTRAKRFQSRPVTTWNIAF